MKDIKLLKEVTEEHDALNFPLDLDGFINKFNIFLMSYTDSEEDRKLIGGYTRNKTIAKICKLISYTFDNESKEA